MRYLDGFAILAISLLFLVACAGESDDAVHIKPGSPPPSVDVVPTPLPNQPGQGDEPSNRATFALVAPNSPVGADIIPLTVRLKAVTDATISFDITSTTLAQWSQQTGAGQNGTASGEITLPSGSYRLAYLDELGNETGIQEANPIVVQDRKRNRRNISAVHISPQSAAFPEATTVSSLSYRIAAPSGESLKTVQGAINRVVHLPDGSWQWYGQGKNAELVPLQMLLNNESLELRFGSILVTTNYAQVQLEDATGQTIVPEMLLRTEYLLPALPQAEGCMVYTVRFPIELTQQQIQLCSDTLEMHVQL